LISLKTGIKKYAHRQIESIYISLTCSEDAGKAGNRFMMLI